MCIIKRTIECNPTSHCQPVLEIHSNDGKDSYDNTGRRDEGGI